jgi:hypothetical protein
MGAKQNSYDYQNLVRDVIEVFNQLRVSYPSLISLVKTGPVARNTKHEWTEDALVPTSTAITSFGTDGDGTVFNVSSSAGLRVGSVVRFESSAGASKTEQAQVSVINSATQITIVRDYGSTTGVTLLVGDIIKLVSSPINEGTEAGDSDGQEPTMAYNFTQIFDRVAKVTKTGQNVDIYGLGDVLDYQVQVKMSEIIREMNSGLIYGRRVERTSTVAGTAGGILQFMEGGNIDTTGGAISATIINNILEAIFNDGGFSNNYAIVCNQNQARKISAFNTSGSNPVVQKAESDRNFGGYVSMFTGDLPVMDGFRAAIVVEPNFPADQLAVVDMNSVELNWLQNRSITDEDASPAGADYVRRRILGEATYTIKNGTKQHGLATGLTI